MKSLQEEFDLFRIMVTPSHSPSCSSVEVLNKYLKKFILDEESDNSDNW